MDVPTYAKPHFFDWGVYKAYGELVLLLSSAFYLGCLAGAIIMVRGVGRMLRSTNSAIFFGTFLLGPMVFMAWRSVGLQLSSAHYQESTHIPAVTTVLVCFAFTFLLWYLVRSCTNRSAA